MMAQSAIPSAMNSKIWIPNKHKSWDLADLISFNEDEVVIEDEEGRKIMKKNLTQRADPTHFIDTDDLCTMNHLHVAPLLDCLRRRFLKDKIYTAAGNVLISVNPYRTIPGLYDNILSYEDIPDDDEFDEDSTPPHVFKIANYALNELVNGKRSDIDRSIIRNQSIVVSGESGAGKTEASKQVMSFLIEVDDEKNKTKVYEEIKETYESDKSFVFDLYAEDEEEYEEDGSSKKTKKSSKSSRRLTVAVETKLGDIIREVLLQSNVIFEAFGNAKTVRNNNSSRFGKYIKLQYSAENRIISAYTETFLLEKSRLFNVGTNERNYHIFYQFFVGNTDEELKNRLKLRSPGDFKMLLDKDGMVGGCSEDERYEDLVKAFQTLGFSDAEVTAVWELLATILHLGNLECKSGNEKTERAQITSVGITLDELAEMLGVDRANFESHISTHRVKIGARNSITSKMLTSDEVMNNIRGLVKWIYSNLFSWLLKKVNLAHTSTIKSDVKVVKFIGILDIFGFEILESNSFEQLCINFTNERLQQHFNEYVFDREQELYRSEGLDWQNITYTNNQSVIDLIAKKPNGLLYILEAQQKLNRASTVDFENGLLATFNQTHEKTAEYEKSRFTSDGKFTVKHFAGDVSYVIHGFLDKNNDALQEDLMELMYCSTNPFILNAIVSQTMDKEPDPNGLGYIKPIDGNQLVSAVPVEQPGALGPKRVSTSALANSATVSQQFRNQLDLLLLTLRATSPHYIKCIRPNADKGPGSFDKALVLQQLQYSGALEMVRIRQEGFPVCQPYIPFYETFEILAFGRGWQEASVCSTMKAMEYSAILASEVLEIKVDFQIGETKMFMRAEGYEKMHQAINAFLGKKVSKFQALVKKIKAKQEYEATRRAICLIQKCARMLLSRSKFKKMKEERRLQLEEEAKKKDEQRKNALLSFNERANLLHETVEKGDLEAAQAALMEHPEDYNARYEKGHNRTLLHSAILGGHMEMLRYFAPKAMELYLKDSHGNSAVHYAVVSRGNKVEILRYLAFLMEPLQQQLQQQELTRQKQLIEQQYKRSTKQTQSTTAENTVVRPRHSKIPSARFSTIAGPGNTRLSILAPLPPLPPKEDEDDPDAAIEEENEEEEEHDTVDRPLGMRTTLKLVAKDATMIVPGAGRDTVLKSGWLSKRGESSMYRKRWVVLTSESLMYFRNNTDKVPRDTLSLSQRNDISIERNKLRPTALDLTFNKQSERKKRTGISLMAESEQEVQVWMNLLKAAAGVICKPISSDPEHVTRTVTPTLRSGVLSAFNSNRMTALHLLCDPVAAAFVATGEKVEVDPNSDRSASTRVDISTAAWLINNGCPVDAFTSVRCGGVTALQNAVKLGMDEMTTLLVRMGADPVMPAKGSFDAPPEEKRGSLELAKSATLVDKMWEAYSIPPQAKFLKEPPRLRGFHYLSICFLDHLIEKADYYMDVNDLSSYYLQTTVYNASNNLPAESEQTSYFPLKYREERPKSFLQRYHPQSFSWPQQYFLQVPLDNLEDMSYIVIELKKAQSISDAGNSACKADHTTLAWQAITLNKNKLDSESRTVYLLKPPVVYDPAKAEASILNTSTLAPGVTEETQRLQRMQSNKLTQISMDEVHSQLELEIIITKRGGALDNMYI